MQVRKGDIVRKKKILMILLYSLIFITLIVTIVLKVKSLKTEPKRITDELMQEEINEIYYNDKVDYYTYEEVNNQEYLVSSDEKIISDNNSNDKEINNDTNSEREKQSVAKPTEPNSVEENNNIIENKTDKQEQTIVNQQVDETPQSEIVIDDSVDTNGFDYHIHKGRIDCMDSKSCMDISIPIQLKYKKSISNAYYLEVISKRGNTLGYFIEYAFVEYDYKNVEKCNEIGNLIKDSLSDRVIGFTCSPEGILKINTDY